MKTSLRVLPWVMAVATGTAMAHDPIFGIGPHVLFKDGYEVSVEMEADKAGSEQTQSLSLELTYGLTGDWAVGVDLPYEFIQDSGDGNNGNGDIALFTKYRFWRQDSLGLQESASALLKVVTDTADDSGTPSLNKGTTDTVLGLTYGYEGRKWYAGPVHVIDSMGAVTVSTAATRCCSTWLAVFARTLPVTWNLTPSGCWNSMQSTARERRREG